MKEKLSKEEYNEIPVIYCKTCLSLNIKKVPGVVDLDYCDTCSSTSLGEASIEEWEELYKHKYGFKLLDKKY